MSQAAEEIRAFLRSRKHTPIPPTLQEARMGYEEMAKMFPLAADTTTEKILVNGINAEWISTPNTDKNYVMLYLHGGGYVLGSPNTHRALVSRLADATKSLVLLLDYRLAPEHPFPSAVEDAVSAYRWLLNNGFSNENIFICGDSAGGGLTLATAISLCDANEKLPKRLALISPWTDLAATGDSLTTLAEIDPWLTSPELTDLAKLYLATTDSKHPLASPLFADLSGLPEMLIQVGADEILLDDSIRLAKKAEEMGVNATLEVWKGMWHVWHAFADKLSEGQEAINKIGLFLRR
ncbi:MAG: alpha/beta hydrolase [Blastocatellia bacterium]